MVKTVALVEDEKAIRENYSDALVKQGYRVSVITSYSIHYTKLYEGSGSRLSSEVASPPVVRMAMPG